MLLNRRSAIQALAAAAAADAAPASFGFAASPPPQDVIAARPQVLSQGRTQTYAPGIEILGRYIDTHLREYALPGMICAVTDRDGFAALITAGFSNVAAREPIRSEQLFEIGSISKSFAAICILQAAAHNKLALDEPFAKLMPDLPLPAERLTVRQLLCHNTGLPEDAPAFPLGGPGRLWSGYAPGTRFSYSNTGFEMLGLLLERIYDRPFDEIVRAAVLEPLGMSDTRGSIRVADQAAYALGYWPYYQDRPYVQGARLGPAYFTEFTKASGCIASTAADMTRYLRFLIGAGAGRGAPLLRDADAVAFTTPVTDAGVFGPAAKYALGLGVVPIDGLSCLHHTGGMTSFSSSIHVDPTTGVAAFASTNASAGDYRPRDVTFFACQLMRALRESAAPPAPPDIKRDDRIADAGRYAGAYRSERGTRLELRADGTGLVASVDGGEARLHRVDENAFVIPHPRFERRAIAFSEEGGARIAWWGDVRFVQGAPARSDAKAPLAAEREAGATVGKTGYFASNDPWEGSFQVFARGKELWLDGTKRLVPLPDGSYRVGDEDFGCERVRFDCFMNGRAQRLFFSGVAHERISSDVRDPGPA